MKCEVCGNNMTELEDDSFGCPCCSSEQEFRSAPPPTKTLLDEFAMAALTGSLSNPEVMLDIAEEDLKSLAKAYSICSYEYAAAMMKERARRDEMGNVKEVEQ